MHRHALSEVQWAKLQPLLPRQRGGPAALLGDRLFVEAVLYRAKTGLPWRDLPERFGPWKTVYNRFANWARRGHWKSIFQALQVDVDETGTMLDGSVIRAHQDASGGKGGSKVTLSVTLVEDFPQKFMPPSTSKAAHSISRLRKVNGMK